MNWIEERKRQAEIDASLLVEERADDKETKAKIIMYKNDLNDIEIEVEDLMDEGIKAMDRIASKLKTTLKKLNKLEDKADSDGVATKLDIGRVESNIKHLINFYEQ